MPWVPVLLIGSRIEDIWRIPVNHYINHTHSLIDIENFAPCLSAVRSLKNPSFLVWSEEVTHRGDIDNVGIFGVNNNPADVMCIFESHVHPGVPSID